MLDYEEYLESDHWKKFRAKIRRRAGGYCERCKVGKRADIHHLSYERLGHELPSDVVAVCSECHEWLHGRRSKDPAATEYTPEEVDDLRFLLEWYGAIQYVIDPALKRRFVALLEKHAQSLGVEL